jgi:hypothetical protein
MHRAGAEGIAGAAGHIAPRLKGLIFDANGPLSELAGDEYIRQVYLGV